MILPIKRGTARRLGIRQPGKWEDTMERSDRPGWGSTDCPAAWTETSAGVDYYQSVVYPIAPALQAAMEEFREAASVDWGDPTTRPAERFEVTGYSLPGGRTKPDGPWALRRQP